MFCATVIAAGLTAAVGDVDTINVIILPPTVPTASAGIAGTV